MTFPALPPVIHIGFHKTATTYLQTSVFSNEAVFYLPWGRSAELAVEYFVLQHPARFSPDKARASLLGAVGSAPQLVPLVSNEELSGNPMNGRYDTDRVASRIHQTVPEAKILIGIREQNAAILSNYYQYIRQGGTKPLRHLLTTARSGPGYRPTMRLEHFEYDLTIQHYQELFGHENILVLPVEQLRRSPESYCDALRHFVGTDKVFPLPEKVVNARRTEISMELERRLNNLVRPPEIRAEKYQDNPLAFRAKNRALRHLDSALSRMGVSGGSRLTDEIKTIVAETFAASNARTAKLSGIDLAALGYKPPTKASRP